MMNLFTAQRILSPQARRKTVALLSIVSLAVAFPACDSDDSDPSTTANNTTNTTATNTAETDASGGEATVYDQAELSAEYETLGGLIAEASDSSVWKQFRVQQQAKLSFTGNRLVVNATGDNPIMIMPAFATGQRFLIEAVIHSDKDTTAQLNYLTPGQARYSEDQSQGVELKAGRNVVYFRLDDPNIVDPLRFDPARTPGTYTIERMTARGLPPAD